MPRPLTNHTCEATGCTAKTRLRLDGTPRKYCDPHTAESRERMKAIFADSKAQRVERDELFQVVIDTAFVAGRKAAEEANPVETRRAARLELRPANHRFVNFLRRQQLGHDGHKTYILAFPAIVGSREQAQAIYETLRPLTASGEDLEGLRITLV